MTDRIPSVGGEGHNTWQTHHASSNHAPFSLPLEHDCPHGCKREQNCLRYDQGGSIPDDCALYAIPNRAAGHPLEPTPRQVEAMQDAVRESEAADATPNRVRGHGEPIAPVLSESESDWRGAGRLHVTAIVTAELRGPRWAVAAAEWMGVRAEPVTRDIEAKP